jgi:enoyl-CoA hydratase/carnithine racemase
VFYGRERSRCCGIVSFVALRPDAGHEPERKGIPMTSQFSVVERSPSYWKVTFENGSVNLLDADSVDELADLVTRMQNDPALTVVVFDSANPDFFMAHWDSNADKARVAAMPPGPTGLHPYLDNFVRLSKVPAVTISSIRGRVRGAGSEFVLATDVRFAGDKAILGQPEVGLGAVPGGGPMARLARLAGRGRAAEILFGADDFPAALAAEYGYVNRSLMTTWRRSSMHSLRGSPDSTRPRLPAPRRCSTSPRCRPTRSSVPDSRPSSVNRPRASRCSGGGSLGCGDGGVTSSVRHTRSGIEATVAGLADDQVCVVGRRQRGQLRHGHT